MIAVIDYGIGNVFSLVSSLKSLGQDVIFTGEKDIIRSADKVILPGVGAFADAAELLSRTGMDSLVKELAKEGKPLMGICLGMQLLFDRSFEYGEHAGLGLIPGDIVPLRGAVSDDLPIPQMGWNSLQFQNRSCPVFRDTKEGDYVYFVHSFYATHCEDSVVCTVDYSIPVTAAVCKGNVIGCQFHPEKSGEVGLRILKNFCEMEQTL